MDSHHERFWNLYQPEHPQARAFCRKLMPNREDGDDLLQDGLLRALSRFETLRNSDAFRPWLYRILINTFRNRYRRRWWTRQTSLTDEMASTLSGDDPVPVQAARRRLAIAFRALKPRDRALVTLFEIQGWSIGDLACLTGRSEGSLKTRLSRARAKMRQALLEYFRSRPGEMITKTFRSEEEICVVTKPVKD
jgi:RNA polymerase sigma-70 factor (ECF subfamily)